MFIIVQIHTCSLNWILTFISSVEQTACENTKMSLSCPTGEVVNIQSVVYGSTDNNDQGGCPVGYTPPDDSCRSAHAPQLVRDK